MPCQIHIYLSEEPAISIIAIETAGCTETLVGIHVYQTISTICQTTYNFFETYNLLTVLFLFVNVPRASVNLELWNSRIKLEQEWHEYKISKNQIIISEKYTENAPSLMSEVSLSFWPVQFFGISLYSTTFLLNMFLLLDTSVHDLFLLPFLPLQDFFLMLTVCKSGLFFHESLQHCSIRLYISIKISFNRLTPLFNTGLCPWRYPFKIVLYFIQESS
jgi:hypothetical protein